MVLLMLIQNHTDFNPNTSSYITSFWYCDLVNFSVGSLLQYKFLTAIFIYMIDRNFLQAVIWSLLAAGFVLFDVLGVGILTQKWWWMEI